MTGETEAERRWDGYLGPRIWASGAILAIAAIAALGVLYVRADGGGTTINIQQCDPSQPGCELRQTVHWHADFAVVINGEQVDFGQPQYISTAEDEKSIYAHIHDPRHTVVHVHYEQTTWAEFFESLGIQLGDGVLTMDDGTRYVNNDTAKWHYVKNGVLIDTLRFTDIGNLDRVLFIYGDETGQEALDAWVNVSDEACIPSGLCADRYPPGGPEAEPCGVGSSTCN